MSPAKSAGGPSVLLETERLRCSLRLNEDLSAELASQHRWNEKALAGVESEAAVDEKGTVWICVGSSTFFRVKREDAKPWIRQKGKDLWERLEKTQRTIAAQEKQLDTLEQRFREEIATEMQKDLEDAAKKKGGRKLATEGQDPRI